LNRFVQYGKSVSEIEELPDGAGIVARFEDGSSYSGATLIGTDGAKSKVRELILGEKGKPSSVGFASYGVVVCYGDAERAKTIRAVHPINHVALHPEEGMCLWTSSEFHWRRIISG
jgi:2-polyprenyl-6-methoxyphenol hydroxylase-like FAD-dependent oxidoreductase